MESGWKKEHGISPRTIRLIIGLGIASPLIGIGAVMAATNPNPSDYQAYATKRLVAYVDESICSEAPSAFDLRKQCRSLLKSNQAEIRRYIAQNTHQTNYIFFSIYTTDLSVGEFLPSYRVETIGAFQQFHIYETERE